MFLCLVSLWSILLCFITFLSVIALSVFMLRVVMFSDCANCQSLEVLIIRLTVVAPQKKLVNTLFQFFLAKSSVNVKASWAQFYNTFYVRNLRMFVIS